MKIAGLQKVSLIDYPGHIAATVFLAGCNLDCGYCHNRWMIRRHSCPEALSRDDLLAWLESRVGLLDGVCVSGGEPTLNPDLPDLLRAIKQLRLSIKLDTNGTHPDRLARLIEDNLVDYVAMDLKAPLDERYDQVAGCTVDLDAIHQSLQVLREHDVPYELRTTVGPGLDEQALRDMADIVNETEQWYLQLFSPAESVDPVWRDRPALDEDDLVGIANRLVSRVTGVCVRGVTG